MKNQEQINEWSRLYGRQITEEEYRDICYNLRNFFNHLVVLDEKYPKRSESS